MNVPGHEMRTVHDAQQRVIRAECSCGEWSGVRDWNGRAGSLTALHIEHQRGTVGAFVDLRKSAVRDWYERTGHCGACGSPGTYCLCTSPCGCADLHPVGSGLQPGALDGFAEAPAVEQGELFG